MSPKNLPYIGKSKWSLTNVKKNIQAHSHASCFLPKLALSGGFSMCWSCFQPWHQVGAKWAHVAQISLLVWHLDVSLSSVSAPAASPRVGVQRGGCSTNPFILKGNHSLPPLEEKCIRWWKIKIDSTENLFFQFGLFVCWQTGSLKSFCKD